MTSFCFPRPHPVTVHTAPHPRTPPGHSPQERDCQSARAYQGQGSAASSSVDTRRGWGDIRPSAPSAAPVQVLNGEDKAELRALRVSGDVGRADGRASMGAKGVWVPGAEGLP